MTQQQEKLSAFMDGETDSAEIMEAILNDEELKTEICARWPYGRWLKKNVFDLSKR